MTHESFAGEKAPSMPSVAEQDRALEFYTSQKERSLEGVRKRLSEVLDTDAELDAAGVREMVEENFTETFADGWDFSDRLILDSAERAGLQALLATHDEGRINWRQGLPEFLRERASTLESAEVTLVLMAVNQLGADAAELDLSRKQARRLASHFGATQAGLNLYLHVLNAGMRARAQFEVDQASSP